MSFDEIRLPENVEVGAEGGLGFKTTILTLWSGNEKRNVDWAEARGQWDVGYGARDIDTIHEIQAFHIARAGRARGFLFKDWSDYQAEAQNIGVGTGALTTFQLRKQYISGPVTYNRLIYKPVDSSIRIFLNGIETFSFAADDTTGIVTITPAPGNGVVVTATFEFNVPVRFDIDQLRVSLIDAEIGRAPNIPIVELRNAQ